MSHPKVSKYRCIDFPVDVSNSPTLTGNAGKTDGKQYDVYRIKSIHEMMTSKEGGTSLVSEEDCRMAMVFIALLAGGDYVPEGLEQFGRCTFQALVTSVGH